MALRLVQQALGQHYHRVQQEAEDAIGFCILGHAEEEKAKTEIIPGRVFYI